MKDPNIFNKNIPQNPFQQIQGNIQLFQPNSPWILSSRGK